MSSYRNDRPGFLQYNQVLPSFVPTTLVDGAMPPIISSRGNLRARIVDALGGAARCQLVALGQRRVAAFVIVAPSAVHVQANRIVYVWARAGAAVKTVAIVNAKARMRIRTSLRIGGCDWTAVPR